MSTVQKRRTTVVDPRLSILLRDATDLDFQFRELIKLGYRVRQAELSARNRAPSHSGARSPNQHLRVSL